MSISNKLGLEIASDARDVAKSVKFEVSLPQATDEMCVVDRKGLPLVKYACGHLDHRSFAINIYGLVMNLKTEILLEREKCGDCILAEAVSFSIRCALCGHVIMPGDAVSLYKMDKKFREDATTIEVGDGKDAVGCMRKHCCLSGMFFAGHWTKHGFETAFSRSSSTTRKLYTW